MPRRRAQHLVQILAKPEQRGGRQFDVVHAGSGPDLAVLGQLIEPALAAPQRDTRPMDEIPFGQDLVLGRRHEQMQQHGPCVVVEYLAGKEFPALLPVGNEFPCEGRSLQITIHSLDDHGQLH
jgi:hypothetical protein